MNAKTIEKKMRKKIGHTKIQELINYYFYAKEFLIWIKSHIDETYQPISGNFTICWEYISKFDRYIEDEKLEYIEVIELIE